MGRTTPERQRAGIHCLVVVGATPAAALGRAVGVMQLVTEAAGVEQWALRPTSPTPGAQDPRVL